MILLLSINYCILERVKNLGCVVYKCKKKTINLKNSIAMLNQFLSFTHFPTNFKPTKYPIVLCHGLSGFDSLVLLPRPHFKKKTLNNVVKDGLIKVDYWYGIQQYLHTLGCEVYISKVPLFGTIDQRAHDLHTYLDNHFRGSNKPINLNLIAHSMGGLDSRYLVSKFKSGNYQVVSLTTVSTPHYGSNVADFILRYIKSPLMMSRALPQLTTSFMSTFNKNVPNNSKVAYFSYGARFDPKWYNVFYVPHQIIRHEIESKNAVQKTDTAYDNDGLVSVESARWGEYMGTLNGVDHLDLINWTNRLRTMMQVFSGNGSQFNALAFYSHLIQTLHSRGF